MCGLEYAHETTIAKPCFESLSKVKKLRICEVCKDYLNESNHGELERQRELFR